MTGGGEELLHQTFFVGLEGVELLGLGRDQLVEGGKTVGDFLLFWKGRIIKLKLFNFSHCKLLLSVSKSNICNISCQNT